MLRAKGYAEVINGPWSHELIAIELARANLHENRSNDSEAEKIYQSLIREDKKSPGKIAESQRVTFYNNLGALYKQRGDMDAALPLIAKADEIRQHDVAPDPTENAYVVGSNHAWELAEHEKYEDAAETYPAVIKELKMTAGQRSSLTIDAISDFAQVLRRLGKYEEAIKRQDEVVLLQEGAGAHAESLAREADLYWLAGRNEDSKKTMDQAIQELLHVDTSKAIDYWMEAVLRTGLGPADKWNSKALYSQLWCLLQDSLDIPANYELDDVK